MPIGQNAPVMDKLIKITVPLRNNASIANNTSKTRNINIPKSPSVKTPAENNTAIKKIATENTVKMTFYIKQDILDKLYNFAYWDRRTVTEAFNTVMTDGLKGKNTSPKK